MLKLKLNHVSKRGPRGIRVRWSIRTLPWTVEDEWSRLLYSGECRTVSACHTPVQRNNCVSFNGLGVHMIQWGSWAGFLRPNCCGQSICGNLNKIYWHQWKYMFGDHQHPFTFQHDNAAAPVPVSHQWLENNGNNNIIRFSQSPDLYDRKSGGFCRQAWPRIDLSQSSSLQTQYTPQNKFSNTSIGWPTRNTNLLQWSEHRQYHMYILQIWYNKYSIYAKYRSHENGKIIWL